MNRDIIIRSYPRQPSSWNTRLRPWIGYHVGYIRQSAEAQQSRRHSILTLSFTHRSYRVMLFDFSPEPLYGEADHSVLILLLLLLTTCYSHYHYYCDYLRIITKETIVVLSVVYTEEGRRGKKNYGGKEKQTKAEYFCAQTKVNKGRIFLQPNNVKQSDKVSHNVLHNWFVQIVVPLLSNGQTG